MANNFNKPRVANGLQTSYAENLDCAGSLLKAHADLVISINRPELRNGADKYTDWCIYNLTEACEYDRYLIASGFYGDFQTTVKEKQKQYLESVFVAGAVEVGISSVIRVPDGPHLIIVHSADEMRLTVFGEFELRADKLKRQKTANMRITPKRQLMRLAKIIF